MALVLLGLAAAVMGWRLLGERACGGGAICHSWLAMVIYWRAGPLSAGGFGGRRAVHGTDLRVADFRRFAYGHPIGPVRILAVAIGFLGVVLVLGAGGGLGCLDCRAAAGSGRGDRCMPPATSPPENGRCPEESAQTLLGGFFPALGVLGLIGMIVLARWSTVPEGDGSLQRGAVWPSATFYLWTFVQAAGSLLGVGLMIRAYQITDAGRASVLEYLILPASAIWSYVIWGETLSLQAIGGMALIVLAGSIIALCGQRLKKPEKEGGQHCPPYAPTVFALMAAAQ